MEVSNKSNSTKSLNEINSSNNIQNEVIIDYHQKLKLLEENLVKEQQQNEILKLESKEKDKRICTISLTNTRLMQNLDELRKVVDEHFDKVSFKHLNEKIKKTKEENKQNPLEIVIKVKEKELKNANQLVEILRKDNEQLLKNIGIFDFKSVLEARDKLKIKEKENSDLLIEIKTLNKGLEDHKKCPNLRKEIENELKILKEDYKLLKDNLRIHQVKIKEDEKNHDKTVNQLFSLKKELDKLNRGNDSHVVNKLLNNIEKKSTNNLNHDNNLEEVLKNVEDEKIINKKSKLLNTNYENIKKQLSKINEDKAFSTEEKVKLEKVLTKTEVDKIEKKFETLDHSMKSVQKKYQSDLKILIKKNLDQQERLEFLSHHLKESEQKIKISNFQINEYKNEQKVYQRKLNEMQGQIDSILNVVKEKDIENKILLNQLNSLRKIVKHNSVPPIDNEIVRHLEKIKNEDINSTSFNNDLIEVPKENNNKFNDNNSEDNE